MKIGRNKTIDLVRGVMIILMVLGHIGFGDIFDIWIHAFHMPAFFIISGYFFDTNKTAVEFLKDKTYKLLVPYIATGISIWLLWVFVEGRLAPDRILPMLYSVLWVNTEVFPVAGALWFLTCLFFAEVGMFLILKIANRRISCFLCVICVVVGALLPRFGAPRFPWSIDVSFMAIGFIGVGYFSRQIREGMRIKGKHIHKKTALTISIVAWIFLIGINGYVNMKFMQYSIMPLFLLNGIAGTAIWYEFLSEIQVYFEKSFLWNRIENEISFIGRNSLIYLCFNQVLITAFNTLIEMNGVFPLIKSIFCSGVVLWILHIMCLIIYNTPLRIFYGRKGGSLWRKEENV